MSKDPVGWYDVEFWNARPAVPQIIVHEPERRVIETGLVDQYGRKLVREERPHPIGYVHFPERDR